MLLDTDFLCTTKACMGLTPDEADKLTAICEKGEANKGDEIFAEASEASKLYILAKGKVDLRYKLPGKAATKETTISTAKAGAPSNSTDTTPHSADGTSVTNVFVPASVNVSPSFWAVHAICERSQSA